MILLCNPHNPGATVYTQQELSAIHVIAKRHDLLVVSDEIHCDLILNDARHIPFASLNEDAAQRTNTLMAPSKTFNLLAIFLIFKSDEVLPNSSLSSEISFSLRTD